MLVNKHVNKHASYFMNEVKQKHVIAYFDVADLDAFCFPSVNEGFNFVIRFPAKCSTVEIIFYVL